MVLAFGFWQWWSGRTSEVFDSVVDPVTVTIRPPQYAAEMPHAFGTTSPGQVVRAGGHTRRIPQASQGVWLDDGRYLVVRGDDARMLDPRDGSLTPLRGMGRRSIWELPGEATHRLNVSALPPAGEDAPEEQLLSFAPDASSVRQLHPPLEPDGEAGSQDLLRNVSRRVFAIGEWSYVHFSDNDGEDATQEYGYLRQRQGEDSWEKVLLGERLVALWVSRDGRALLGLQQVRGEPCGGCSARQQVVEIDPVAGKIAATYGVPDDYDKSWRVGEIDKVGDRVLVRYVKRSNTPQNLGVWQYDGDWSLVPGTDGAFTWWQGPDDRIEARTTTDDPDVENAPVHLFWVHGERATRLPGMLFAHGIESWRGAPGSLVPLD